MDAKLRARLESGAERLGFRLDERQVERFERLLDLLNQWNRRINLTALREPEAQIDRHLVDSLAVAAVVRAGAALDAGTGPGFPGLPLAVARPDVRVTLLESIHKKSTFVRTAARELELAVEVVTDRLEQWAPAHAAQFETVVSRALMPPRDWVLAGAPLVAPGGQLLAMVGANEPPPDPPVGFAPADPWPYELPDGTYRRLLRYRRGT